MHKRISGLLIFSICISLFLSGCETVEIEENPSISAQEWELILDSAKNTTVTLVYCAENEHFIKWINESIMPMLSDKFIKLKLEKRSNDEIIKKLVEDKKNDIDDNGLFDLVYIEDDLFDSLYKKDLIYFNFLNKLPNYHACIHPEDVEFTYEQGLKTQGSHVPISREQLCFVYDEDMIEFPPETMDELIETIKSAPNQFTFPLPDDLSGRLFMQTFIANFIDYEKLYKYQYTRGEIKEIIEPALIALENLKPKLWHQGNEYPISEQELDKMFFKGEVAFSLSMDPNKPLRLSKAEEYPYAARGFVLDDGTAGTNGGLVIPFNAVNKSGALVVINEMISVQGQAYKYNPKGWGNIPVIRSSIMKTEDIQPILKVGIKRNNVKQESFNEHRLVEIPKKTSDIMSQLWTETMLKADE